MVFRNLFFSEAVVASSQTVVGLRQALVQGQASAQVRHRFKPGVGSGQASDMCTRMKGSDPCYICESIILLILCQNKDMKNSDNN